MNWLKKSVFAVFIFKVFLTSNCISQRFDLFFIYLKSYEHSASNLFIRGRTLFSSFSNVLSIHDITDPQDPKPLTSHTFEKDISDFYVSGNLIFVATDKIYLLYLSRDYLNEVTRIDIEAKKIEVYGDLLYALSMDQIFVVNVGDVHNPKVAKFNVESILDFTSDGEIIYIATGNNLIFSRVEGDEIKFLGKTEKRALKVALGSGVLSLMTPEFYIEILDVSSINQPEVRERSYHQAASSNIMVVQGNFIFNEVEDSEIMVNKIEYETLNEGTPPGLFPVGVFYKGDSSYSAKVKDVSGLFPYVYVATGERVDIFKMFVKETTR